MEAHSILRRIVCIAWIIAGLTFAPHPTVAEEANAPAQKTIGATKTGMVPSLIVMNAQGASLQGETLTLNGVAPSSIVFADRPVRAAGHMLTTHLLAGGVERARASQRIHLTRPFPFSAKMMQRSMTLSSF
jgi:hypothetical protein